MLLSLISIVFAKSIPADVWYNSVLKYIDNFNDVLGLGLANREILTYLSPILAIKRHCLLNNADVWPLTILNLHGHLDQQCLEYLNSHSHIYQAATVIIPIDTPLSARGTIELLKPNLLNIIFPDYNQLNQGTQRIWPRLNSLELNSILQSIPNYQNKRISITMRFYYY